MKHRQPAEISYFFYGGFVDMSKIILGAFNECGKVISKSAEGTAEHFGELIYKIKNDVNIFEFQFSGLFTSLPHLFKFGFYLAQLIFCFIVTPLVCVIISMFQTIILLLLLSIMLIFFGFVILIDRIFCTINAIANHCPICQKHFYMPVYMFLWRKT